MASSTPLHINERTPAEESLHESEQWLAGIVHSAMDAIISVNERQRIRLFNPAAEKMFGLRASEAIGQPLSRLIPERFRQAHEEHIRNFANTGVTSRRMGALGEVSGVRANGEEFPLEASISQAVVGEAKIFTVILRELTERKRADQQMRADEARWRGLLALLPAAVYTCDSKGHITYFNPRAVELWGRTPCLGESNQRFCGSFRLYHPDGRLLPHDQTPMAEALRHGTSYRNHEVMIEHVGGRRVWVSVNIDPIIENGVIVGAVNCFADETERKLAEAKLRESEERFRQLAEAMPQLVWTANADGSIDYYNRRLSEFHGDITCNADGTWGWQPILHPDDIEPTANAWQTTVASGQPYQCEHRVRMADGSIRWHLSRALPVRDEAGNVVKWLGTATDIHDLKLAQEALREADRRKNEYLATLGHELRNPLAPIRNAVEILKLKGPPDTTVQAALDLIERQLQHMVRLVDDLLDVSRITRGKLELRRERVTLSAVLEQALEAARPHLERAGHELTLSLPAEPIDLDADPVRLAQVFLNLLNNACKYTAKGGHIRLSAERDGTDVAVKVRDTGIGIPPEHLPRVFEMFSQVASTLEQSQDGLGIGLWLARGLLEMHGGRIEALSEGAGKGSEFIVRLPVLPAVPPATQPPPPEHRDDLKAPLTRRILIVDDNRDIIESLALLLRLTGNEVQTACDGLEAIEAAERYRPEVVLLDIRMPRLDGYTACRRIRETPWGKDMVIIALTGWGHEDDRRKSKAAGFDNHLVKPVKSSALLQLLAETQVQATEM